MSGAQHGNRPRMPKGVTADTLRGARVASAGNGRYHGVDRDGRPITGEQGSPYLVEERLDVMRRHLSRRERPCITCRQPMLSDGPQHRMCPTCRAKADDAGLI